MGNIGLSLIIGISSSLVATALFILLSEFIRRVIIPWYADKIYRGVRIDGEWEATVLSGNEDAKETMEENDMFMRLSLSQKGETIKGGYTHKNINEEADEYHLEGRIRDMYFLATAIPKSNRKIDGISFLFHIDYKGSKLRMIGGVLSQGKAGEVLSHNGIGFEWKNS
ncbi:hypothetical protein [Thiomicrorhabdus heinhorstiae]|uniref:SMODS-associating 2TM beta-strand rich effector domain-containing protein n=1 Tax=Thiomicrorhabdus heinhorstiae TaxID=2748010 RepID=A0ABS0BV96_9GAMM|nr:hypothetical protein [Thiomicrorhabdus heinhorstiae]MBF6057748.1 hypothetical protein [Thiomicrorhabdus heinhorstiae]